MHLQWLVRGSLPVFGMCISEGDRCTVFPFLPLFYATLLYVALRDVIRHSCVGVHRCPHLCEAVLIAARDEVMVGRGLFYDDILSRAIVKPPRYRPPGLCHCRSGSCTRALCAGQFSWLVGVHFGI